MWRTEGILTLPAHCPGRRDARPDGGWDGDVYTCTGSPRDFHIGYELYRDVFPVLAPARLRRTDGASAPAVALK